MRIILNDELSQKERKFFSSREEDLEEEKSSLLKKIAYTQLNGSNWRNKDLWDFVKGSFKDDANFYHLGYLGTISKAYSFHFGLEFSPDVVWHTILCELSNLVRLAPEVCKPLFVKDPNQDKKEQIVVLTGSSEDINLFALVEKLKERIQIDSSLFLPDFSTSTQDSKLAHAAALCDAASHYYEYATMLCGIRYIELTGTKADWELACSTLISLAQQFKRINYPEATEYLIKVIDVLVLVADSFNDERLAYNKDFWQDIYTQKNVGSGGDLDISGWIKDLFFTGSGKNNRGNRLESFMTSISLVPYKNLDTGREFKSAHGCFTSVLDDGTLIPRLDYVVFEKI